MTRRHDRPHMVTSGMLPRGLAVLVTLAAVITGCSHPPAAPAASGGITVLSCRDAAGQQAADPQARLVNGVEGVALHGDTNTSDNLPTLTSRDGHHYLLWKTFLAVAATARPYRTVTVTNPATARLFYASPAHWGSLSETKAIGAPPRRIQLPACGKQYTGYTGGILITHPACVTLTVSGPDSNAVTVTVPVLVSRC